MSLTFSFPFVGTPPFYSGTTVSSLVPDVFPVAIDGRPYMVDTKSQEFGWAFEQRVRDSQDTSTSPGEAAINPGGLWRRGQASWHMGAGQRYADDAAAQDYMFYKSKGVNPWTKGRLTLLNSTKLSLSSAATNLMTCVVRSSGGTEYLYVADGSTVRFSSNPFAASPTWTAVTTATSGTLPTTAITGIETNGTNVFIAFTSNDIWYTTPGSTSATFFYPTSGTTGQTYNAFGYAKGWGFAAVDNKLYVIAVGSGSHTVHYTHPDTSFRWVGSAGGSNAVYSAGYSGNKSLIYKLTIKADGTFDVPIVALELPSGEIVSSIFSYLGAIFIGSNKGVRYCSTDSQNNLVAGALIPTTDAVHDFTSDDRFVWFGNPNIDGTSSGLGRLDLSSFVSANTPAHATDLMYTSTADIKSVSTIGGKRIFTVAGVGVIAEDADNLVTTGYIEAGTYRWGIPDRKFIAFVDTRAFPLDGSIETHMALDGADYSLLGTWDDDAATENSFYGSDDQAIEVAYKFVLNRESALVGPVFTRWMTRAYAAPFRSEVFVIPVLIHDVLRVENKDYYLDVDEERQFLRGLIRSPRIITLQINNETVSVIAENLQWIPRSVTGDTWNWQGTAVVTMRSVED